MMIAFLSRALLVAYMCVATVAGPLVCCCTVRAATEAGPTSRCCSGHGTAKKARAPSGTHHHHHGQASHSHAPAKTSSGGASGPIDDNPGDHHCPCGRRHATTLTVAAVDHGQIRSFDVPIHVWTAYEEFDSLLTEIRGIAPAVIAYSAPPGLFGRDMLRAYQIMRC